MAADNQSLRVMCIFEAAARLGTKTELACLAAHIYHRYLRLRHDIVQYCDLFTFGAACLKVAHRFYEQPIESEDLVLAMCSVIHVPKTYSPSETSMKKLVNSVDLACKIIVINLQFKIDYKHSKMLTPGELLRQRTKNKDAEPVEPEMVSYSSQAVDYGSETLLNNNSADLISPQRYLLHYLHSISLLIETPSRHFFRKISSIAWTLMTDVFWSPFVVQQKSSHMACACLTMAIDIVRPELAKRKPGMPELNQLLANKNWNLILCDDLRTDQLNRTIGIIVKQYIEFERMLEFELKTYVSDPIGKDLNHNVRHSSTN